MNNRSKGEELTYQCHGPFTHGTGVCLHGWNSPHALTEQVAQHTDHLTNCGLLPDRQRIDKIEG